MEKALFSQYFVYFSQILSFFDKIRAAGSPYDRKAIISCTEINRLKLNAKACINP
jgi:hypothetical protein